MLAFFFFFFGFWWFGYLIAQKPVNEEGSIFALPSWNLLRALVTARLGLIRIYGWERWALEKQRSRSQIHRIDYHWSSSNPVAVPPNHDLYSWPLKSQLWPVTIWTKIMWNVVIYPIPLCRQIIIMFGKWLMVGNEIRTLWLCTNSFIFTISLHKLLVSVFSAIVLLFSF